MTESKNYFYDEDLKKVIATNKYYDGLNKGKEYLCLGNKRSALIYMNALIEEASIISKYFLDEENHE